MKDIKLKWIRNAVTQDKSFLRHPQSNLPLFQHILQNVILPLNLPGNIVISCRDNAQATRILAVPGVAAIANVVLDDIELLGDIGPARGLLSAHLRYPGITYVVIGVDFPQANSEALYELMAGHKAMDKDSPVTCFVHPEDGHPEPLMSIWTPVALQRLRKNSAKGKSGPCFSAKQLWKDLHGVDMAIGAGLIQPSQPQWIADTDTPIEWEKAFGIKPEVHV